MELDRIYSDVIIFINKIEEIPSIVENLLSNTTSMYERSNFNKLWIQNKVINIF